MDDDIRTIEDLRSVSRQMIQQARVEYWDFVQAAMHEAQELAVQIESAIGEVSAAQAFAGWCQAWAARLEQGESPRRTE